MREGSSIEKAITKTRLYSFDPLQPLKLEAFNSTSRYLDDLLNIDNIYFDQMVDRIYPTELQLNRANSSDTEAPFFGFESMYI